MNPKISIIIPVYNVERYIRQALESVVKQTLNEIEIICVNDCTPDSSFEIVKEYASKDPRFVLLEQETNQGQGVARNRALDIAKGKYIMFLDPDDWYELDACEEAYNQIEKNQNDMVFFNFYRYKSSKKIILDNSRLKPFDSYIDGQTFKFSELKNPYMSFGESVYKIYRTDFIRENDIYFAQERCFEDIEFYTKCLLFAKTVSVLNKFLYYYRDCPNSTLKNQKNLFYIFDVREKIYKDLILNHVDSKTENYYLVAYVGSLLSHYRKIKKYTLKASFYKRMHKVFLSLNEKQIDSFLKEELSNKYYMWFHLCLKNTNMIIFEIKRWFDKLKY